MPTPRGAAAAAARKRIAAAGETQRPPGVPVSTVTPGGALDVGGTTGGITGVRVTPTVEVHPAPVVNAPPPRPPLVMPAESPVLAVGGVDSVLVGDAPRGEVAIETGHVGQVASPLATGEVAVETGSQGTNRKPDVITTDYPKRRRPKATAQMPLPAVNAPDQPPVMVLPSSAKVPPAVAARPVVTGEAAAEEKARSVRPGVALRDLIAPQSGSSTPTTAPTPGGVSVWLVVGVAAGVALLAMVVGVFLSRRRAEG